MDPFDTFNLVGEFLQKLRFRDVEADAPDDPLHSIDRCVIGGIHLDVTEAGTLAQLLRLPGIITSD